MAAEIDRPNRVRRLHVFSFLLGIWLVLAPFLLHYGHTVATTNEVIIGLVIAFLSFVRLRSPSDTWTSWSLAGIGLWLVLSPFIFGYHKDSTYWNELLLGIVLIIFMFSAVGHSIRHHSHLTH